MKKHKAEIGSISHGTMRDEDLIPCFLNHIQWLDPKRITKLRKNKEWKRITDALRKGDKCLPAVLFHEDGTNTIMSDSDWSEYTSELFDILNEYAPPYCTFGSSEGDGADYGFWVSNWDDIKEETDALIVSDLSEIPKGYRGEVFNVNDHGNVTLYTCNSKGKLTEIWSIV